MKQVKIRVSTVLEVKLSPSEHHHACFNGSHIAGTSWRDSSSKLLRIENGRNEENLSLDCLFSPRQECWPHAVTFNIHIEHSLFEQFNVFLSVF
jgi:hypothetical protein